MDIAIPGLPTPLPGTTPVVILGANGSGKTRLAVQMSNAGNAEFIGAVRQIAIPDTIPNWTLAAATNELENRTSHRRSSHWEVVSDIEALFGKLWSAHTVEAMRIYEQFQGGVTPTALPETVLSKTRRLWEIVFPGRSIEFKDYAATVSNEYLGSSEYAARQMSDGERTGLYLAARILDSKHPIIIVDEPESHFHSRLAVRFWDALETMCSDKRFVYTTHDLNFSLSRKSASIVLVRPNEAPGLVAPGASLPPDDVASILGAASFSVYAKRLVFCEGREERSLDQELLRAWFNERGTALVPVGGCENVKRCTAAFQTSSVVSGFAALGIIDRDHWPDEFLASVSGLHVLDVHEIESLYVLKPVYLAVAAHLGLSATAEQTYSTAHATWRRQAEGTLANKLVCERFKAKSMMLLERAFASAADHGDREASRVVLTACIPASLAVTNPSQIWDEQVQIVDEAIRSSDSAVFLRVLPGKPLVGPAATSLGITKERYCDLVKTGLMSSEPAFASLSAALEAALLPYLPPRTT